MKTIIEIKNLSKSYREGPQPVSVLQELNLSVPQGETVAIVGQSGSGKSTLLSLMAGLDNPDTGTITIADQTLANLSETQLSKFRGKNIGIVFQQFHLMPSLTALENVALPLEILKQPGATHEASQALSWVGLQERQHHFPHQLSGGECQRVAIARAFVSNPSLLLADEPSGNLDDTTGRKVIDLLFNLVAQKNMTLILVTHNHELASRCHRMLRLANGQLHVEA